MKCRCGQFAGAGRRCCWRESMPSRLRPTIRRPSSLSWPWRWGRLLEFTVRRRGTRASPRTLSGVGDGVEIIYVPCQPQPQWNYLLMSYIIYRKGFAVSSCLLPGANLNMAANSGVFLAQRGGAFFLRRSFKGDALYPGGCFAKVPGFMMARGHSARIISSGGRPAAVPDASLFAGAPACCR